MLAIVKNRAALPLRQLLCLGGRVGAVAVPAVLPGDHPTEFMRECVQCGQGRAQDNPPPHL